MGILIGRIDFPQLKGESRQIPEVRLDIGDSILDVTNGSIDLEVVTRLILNVLELPDVLLA